jgi:hypothetical protein
LNVVFGVKQPFLLLLFAVVPAFAQEIPVSDPTFESQQVESTRVAASGDRFITVWGRGGNTGIYASVTDLAGTLLRGPVTVSITGSSPAVASGPNGALAAWSDGTTAYTAVIDRAGNVKAKSVLADFPYPGGRFAVASNGSRFLVLVYTSQPVVGYLFDENGSRLTDKLAIGEFIASATADGDAFLVFAAKNVDDQHPEKGQTIWARRIESSGTMQPWTQTSSVITYPRIAAAGRVLFWEYGGVLHRVVTDQAGAAISDQVIATATQELHKAVETSAGVLLFLSDQNWSVMLVGSDGRVIAQKGPMQGTIDDIASIGARALLARGLSGRFMDATTTLPISGPFSLGLVAAEQSLPQVASNGPLLLAVWAEFGTGQLFASRIDLSQRKHLDGRGILLDDHQNAAPAVAPLGNGFIVAYLETSSGVAHLLFRRVFLDGSLDAAPTLVSTTPAPYVAPRLATDGNNVLLIWTENGFQIRATRISRNGAVLDPSFLFFPDPDTGIQLAPDVAFDGHDYVAAWQWQCCSGRYNQFGTSAVHVTPAGVVLSPPTHPPMRNFLRVAGDAIAGQHLTHVLLAVNASTIDVGEGLVLGDVEQFGDGYLVVGTQETGFQRPVKIWASLVDDGNVLSRFEPLPVPTSAMSPSLTRTPAGLALAYTRSTADEGFGGSMRAYVLPIGEQRRRSIK